MTKPILLAGDIHADEEHLFNTLVPAAQEAGCDRIIALGDFGFFWDYPERAMSVAATVLDLGMELWFLDGNHENFDMMSDYGFVPDGHSSGLGWRLSHHEVPGLMYLSRGSTFRWDNKLFMAFGGAVSIDAGARTEHLSWWSQELITEGQVRRVEDNPVKVDVLLSHDVPAGVSVLERFLAEAYDTPYKLDRVSRTNREMLGRVFSAVRPDRVYHGHYHYSYVDDFHGAEIHGLACNGCPESYTILYPETET